MGTQSRVTQDFNRAAAMNEDNYIKTDLKIQKTDEETCNIISSTFGVIKNNILEAFWYSIGFEPNVNTAYTDAMTNPETSFEVQGKKYFQHPGVGNLRAYNESGNPSGGCFTMQVMG
ncbi:hypothetical protein HDR58_05355 [bacterium]|nr:hypothetical protein [bacterium]